MAKEEESLGASLIEGMHELMPYEKTLYLPSNCQPALDLIAQYRQALMEAPTSSRTPTPELQLSDVMERIEKMEKKLQKSPERPLKRRRQGATAWAFAPPEPIKERQQIELSKLDTERKRKMRGYVGAMMEIEDDPEPENPPAAAAPVEIAAGTSTASAGGLSTDKKEPVGLGSALNGSNSTSSLFTAPPKPAEPAAIEQVAKKPAPTFSFGGTSSDKSDESTAQPAQPPKFSFGASFAKAEQPPKDGKPTFSFGGAKEGKTPESNTEPTTVQTAEQSKNSKPLFSFSGGSSVAPSFNFGSNDKATKDSKDKDTEKPDAPTSTLFGSVSKAPSFTPAKSEQAGSLFSAAPVTAPTAVASDSEKIENKETAELPATDSKPEPSKPAVPSLFNFGNTLNKPNAQSEEQKESDKPKGPVFNFGAANKPETGATDSQAEPEVKKPAFAFGASKPEEKKPAFAFGANNNSGPAFGNASESKFQGKPGATADTKSDAAPEPVKPFTFGGDSKPAFSFGTSVTGTNEQKPAGSLFGQASASNTTPAFSFGAAAPTSAAEAPASNGTVSKPATPAFNFGSANPSGSTPAFGLGASSTPFNATSSSASSTDTKPAFGSGSGGVFNFGGAATNNNNNQGTNSNSLVPASDASKAPFGANNGGPFGSSNGASNSTPFGGLGANNATTPGNSAPGFGSLNGKRSGGPENGGVFGGSQAPAQQSAFKFGGDQGNGFNSNTNAFGSQSTSAFNTQPSFNFSAGGTGGTGGFGSTATPPPTNNGGGFNFGTNNSATMPSGAGAAAGGANMFAAGAPPANARKLAPIKRRLPKK